MRVNKAICMMCIEERYPSVGWNLGDEKQWKIGYILCETRLYSIYDMLENECKFAVEQMLVNQDV